MTFEQKHRPQQLSDVVFASDDVRQKLNQYATGKRSKHLLLYGPMGTGKSVSADIILNARVGQTAFAEPFHANTFQNTHDDFVAVMNTWQMQQFAGAREGCIVFDEIDQFTTSMQQRLRAFIDEHSQGMVIGTTNNLHAIDGPLKDRFLCLPIDYPKVERFVPRVVKIMAAEGFKLTETEASIILQGFTGSGRKLNDWIEETALELQSNMTAKSSVQPSLTTNHAAMQSNTNNNITEANNG